MIAIAGRTHEEVQSMKGILPKLWAFGSVTFAVAQIIREP